MGYFVNVVFESPFVNLEAVIFKRARSPDETMANSMIITSHSRNITNNAYNDHNNYINRFSKRLLSEEDSVKDRNSLQPSSSSQLTETPKTSSERNSSSDSDDNKSTTAQLSDQHTTISSPEQDRKLTSPKDNTLTIRDSDSSGRRDLTTVSKSTNLERDLSKHKRWTGREYQGSFKVRASRLLKRASMVEEIFNNQQQHHQVEPLARLNYDSKLPSNSTYSTNEQLARSKQLDPSTVGGKKVPSIERIRKYPFYDPPSLESSTTIDDSLYPITGEYQHYARAGFQQQLYQNHSRPSQYATLARTSKFNHDNSKPLQEGSTEYLRSPYDGNAADSGSSRNYRLGEPISRPLNQYQREASHLMRRRAQLFQRRQGRYNTLTGGAGSIKQWRKQYDGDISNEDVVLASSPSWQPPLWSELAHSNQTPTNSLGGGNFWLKSGNMIPRVDSSTLRRPTNRSSEANIVEEATYEEGDEDEDEQEDQNIAM